MEERSLRRTRALAAWHDGDFYQCGEILSQSFNHRERQSWAAGVLREAVGYQEVSVVVGSLLDIVKDDSRWAEAKAEFNKIRSETIRLEETGGNLELLGIFHLAENVAKITYNAWCSNYEFDEDAGYWIPSCVNFIISHVRDEDRKKRIFDSLWNES